MQPHFFNVDKSRSEDIETCRTHDTMQINEVCEELQKKVEIDKIIRLEKKLETEGARPRPLKVVLKMEDMKRKLIRKSKALREANNIQTKNVFIKPDLTSI